MISGVRRAGLHSRLLTMSGLLLRIHRLPVLPRAHEHLWMLSLMRSLMHHHRCTPAGATVVYPWRLSWSSVRLWLPRRIHGQWRVEWDWHPLWHAHEASTRRLLDHHLSTEVRALRRNHLWSGELPELRRMSIRAHDVLRHWLTICKLGMLRHWGLISHLIVLQAR